MNKYGTIFDELDPKKMEKGERALLIWPIMYYLRRVAFVILVILMRNTLWAQLAV